MERVIDLQKAAIGQHPATEVIVGKSAVAFCGVDAQKSTRKVKSILAGCIERGIFSPDFVAANPSLSTQQPSSDSPQTLGMIHTLYGVSFANVAIPDSASVFLHSRVLFQNSQGRYEWANNANPIPDVPKISVVSGPCLFSAPAVQAFDKDGKVHALTDPGSNDGLGHIQDIKVSKRLQPYEADSIMRLTKMISQLNPEKEVTVNLNVPRLEYYYYALDAYERGLINPELLFSWFEEVDKRANGISNLMKRRIPKEVQVSECTPLSPTEGMIKDAVAEQKHGLFPELVRILKDSDPTWAHAIEASQPDRFLDLGYLSYSLPYIMHSSDPNTLMVAIENPEEAKIGDQARPLMEGFVSNGRFVGLYPHSNVILTSDPEHGEGKRFLYFHNTGGENLNSLRQVSNINGVSYDN